MEPAEPGPASKIEIKEPPGEKRPWLFVALPEPTPPVPFNATRLLWEFELLLNPAGAVRNAAVTHLESGRDWRISGHFVDPTPHTPLWLRQAAGRREDDEFPEQKLVAAFESAVGTLHHPQIGRSYDIASLAPEDWWRVKDEAIPILLGLAVMIPLELGIGYLSASHAEKQRGTGAERSSS